MSSWAGFTDEELSRLRKQNAGGQLQEGEAPAGGRKKATINTAKRQRPREKIRSRAPLSYVKASLDKQEESSGDQRDRALPEQRNTTASNSSERSSVSRLDSREEERENSSPECERRAKKKQIAEEASPKKNAMKKTDDSRENAMKEGAGAERNVISNLPEIIEESDRIQAIELSALEKMQEKQKQIEQENNRKKAALQETIKKRYQRTQAESHTLSLVQKELSHLDSLLSADVEILRDTIEESSREYLHAQKRYEKAEHEFVEAKMDLNRKTERKDLLTEHLYTIIRENELRKAKKLEELMAKLNISSDDTAFVKQLEVENESATKQKKAEMSVSQEEKAKIQNQGVNSELEEKTRSQNQGLNSESSNSQVDAVADTTDKENKAVVTDKGSVTDSLAENEVTLTS